MATTLPRTTPNGQEPVPTIRAVFEWYLHNMPRQPRPVVLVERKRIWEIFCAYRGEDNGAPFGDRAYTSFRPYHLLQFLKAQPGLRSAWTRKRWATYIQCAANEAARMGVIERNPFQGLRLPMGKQGRDWTDDEYRALLRHAEPHFRRFVCFLRFSGARPGEAKAAKWSDWDRETNTAPYFGMLTRTFDASSASCGSAVHDQVRPARQSGLIGTATQIPLSSANTRRRTPPPSRGESG